MTYHPFPALYQFNLTSDPERELSMKLSRQLPLNALRVFEAVARCGSFTKAGAELGMTQTARQLSDQAAGGPSGAGSFCAGGARISLTATGELLIQKVTEAFSLLSEATQMRNKRAEGVLENRSTPTFASHWLARHIGSFQLSIPVWRFASCEWKSRSIFELTMRT